MRFAAIASEPAAGEAAQRILGRSRYGRRRAHRRVSGGLRSEALGSAFAGSGSFGRPRSGIASVRWSRASARSRAASSARSGPGAAHSRRGAGGSARIDRPAALLHAHYGKLDISAVGSAGRGARRRNRRCGAGALLGRIGRRGASALREAVTARPLLASRRPVRRRAAFRARSLAEVRPRGERAPRDRDGRPGGRFSVPWPAPEAPHRIVEVIAAADAHGVLAVLAYSPDDDGLAVPELGLTLPRDANGGQTRYSTGLRPVSRSLSRTHRAGVFGPIAALALGVRASVPVSGR